MAKGRSTVDEVIKILADIDPAIKSLEDLRKKIALVKEQAAKIDITTAAGAEQYDKTIQKLNKLEIAEQKVTSSTVQMTAAMRQAEGQVKGFGDAAAISGGFAIALGQMFSDVGQFGFGFSQGIRAIANNVSQMATMFTMAVVQAGGLRAALRGLWAVMLGPLGVVVAFQAIIGAIDLWAASQRKTKDEVEKLNQKFDIQDGKVMGLYNAYKTLNPASEEAIKIKKALGEELKVNIENYKDLNDAILDHIKVLELEKQISEILDERAKIKIEQRKLEAQNLRQLSELEKIFQDQNERGLNATREYIKNSPEALRLKGEDARLTEMLGELYKQLILLLKTNTKGNKENAASIRASKEEYFNYNRELEKSIQNFVEFDAKVSEMGITSGLDKEALKVFEIDKAYEGLYLQLESYRQSDFYSQEKYFERMKNLESSYFAEIDALRTTDADKQIKIKKDTVDREVYLELRKQQAIGQLASNSIGFLMELNQALAGQTEEQRKKAFQRDKALRVAQAIMDTYGAANAALRMGQGTPAGFVMMAAAIAAGLANVTRIMSTKFDGGSSGFNNSLGGQQGSYPYPMAGFSNIDPQFPDRTGSLDIKPRQFRVYVTESDITGAQKASVEREMRSSVF